MTTSQPRKPVLSVITPAFNSARFLGETLDSVARLTVPHEHLVFDAGSSDGTVDLLSTRDDASLHWVSAPDRGQTHAVNKGLEAATGELIGWLNADDAYVPEAVDRAVGVLTSRPELDAVFGFLDVVDDEGRFSRQYRCGRFSWRRYLYAGEYVATPTIIFRRSLLRGSLRLDERYIDAADYDFYLRVLRGAKVKLVRESLVRFRVHGGSKTSANVDLQMDEAMRIRLAYVQSPPQRWLMRGIRGPKKVRERLKPAWPESRRG